MRQDGGKNVVGECKGVILRDLRVGAGEHGKEGTEGTRLRLILSAEALAMNCLTLFLR